MVDMFLSVTYYSDIKLLKGTIGGESVEIVVKDSSRKSSNDT